MVNNGPQIFGRINELGSDFVTYGGNDKYTATAIPEQLFSLTDNWNQIVKGTLNHVAIYKVR